jgi:ribonuclease P protein component
MLNKNNRLTTKFEFNITRKYGKKFSGVYTHVFILEPRNYKAPSKVGFVVSNKFHKSAVARNKVKRLFRESLRKNLGLIKPNLWIVVHPKYNALYKAYEEINSDVTRLLQKIFIPR